MIGHSKSGTEEELGTAGQDNAEASERMDRHTDRPGGTGQDRETTERRKEHGRKQSLLKPEIEK